MSFNFNCRLLGKILISFHLNYELEKSVLNRLFNKTNDVMSGPIFSLLLGGVTFTAAGLFALDYVS